MTVLRAPAQPGPAARPQIAATRSSETSVPRLDVAVLRDRDEVLLVGRLHARLTSLMGRALDAASPEATRALVIDRFPAALDAEGTPVNRTDRIRLQEALLAEVVGYGPIDALVRDPSISEVMVNGPKQVWVEREGRLYVTDVTFADAEHVMRIIDRIVAPLGRRCDESSPMVDARLPDGSRVNAIIPPLSLVGPVLTIRKFRRVPLSPAELVERGTLSNESLEFLRKCVEGRLNIIVAGGSGAGKTTLLNMLSSYISPLQRIVTIEDAAELQLQQVHVLPLETRPANAEGEGEIVIRDLLRNALRMRPDRIVVGECRGPEALDMLQAMNTGHDGSLTTVHANGPRDALARIETMVLMAGAELPLRAVREQIASAVDLVVHVERMQDGSRRVTQITEVRGMEGDILTMQDLYVLRTEGMVDGRVAGALLPTGIRPAFSDKLASLGIELPATLFGHDRAAAHKW